MVASGVVPEPDPTRIERRLASLVACRTENPPGGGEAEPAGLLAAELGAAGFALTLQPVLEGRPNLVATLGGGGPCLALNSHLDTVPAGPGWEGDPFRLREASDRLVARGACDAKGSVAAMVEAALLLAACRDRWRGARLVVALTVDEEVGSAGAKAFAADHPGVDRIVVGEPTSLRVVAAHKGCLRPRIRVHGRSAHSGTPHLGENAIMAAHRLMALLDVEDRRLRTLHHPLVGPASLSVTRIQGGIADNVVPDACELTVDRRMLPGEETDEVRREIEAILARAGTEAGVRSEILGFTSTAGPSEIPQDDPLVQASLDAARGNGVAEPGPTGFLGGCDLFQFQRVGIKGVVLGPGSLAQAHQPEEWVPRAELLAAASIYRDLALGWFARMGVRPG